MKELIEKNMAKVEESFNEKKASDSMEHALVEYAKAMNAFGMGGMTPMAIAGAINALKKIDADLPKWVKKHIKA